MVSTVIRPLPFTMEITVIKGTSPPTTAMVSTGITIPAAAPFTIISTVIRQMGSNGGYGVAGDNDAGTVAVHGGGADMPSLAVPIPVDAAAASIIITVAAVGAVPSLAVFFTMDSNGASIVITVDAMNAVGADVLYPEYFVTVGGNSSSVVITAQLSPIPPPLFLLASG